MPKNVFEENIVSRVRDQLGVHNDPRQPIEWCVQDMRLASQTLVLTIADAHIEIAVTKKLVKEQSECIERQRKEIDDLKLESLCDRARF